MDDVNVNIALFPLNIFLLPGEYKELYVFEERYKQLIADCEKNSMCFGITVTKGHNQSKLGSIVEVIEIVKIYPQGEMDIVVKATSVFTLKKFNTQKDGKLYPGGEVVILDNIRNDAASERLVNELNAYLLNTKGSNDMLLSSPIGIFDIANELLLGEFEKIELAELPASADRDQYLINYLRFLEILESQEKSVINNIYLN